MTEKCFRVCRSQDAHLLGNRATAAVFHVWGLQPQPISPGQTTHCGSVPSSNRGESRCLRGWESLGSIPQDRVCNITSPHTPHTPMFRKQFQDINKFRPSPNRIIILEVYDPIPSPPDRPLNAAQCLLPIARSSGVRKDVGLGLGPLQGRV